jgi:hypothetical protein
MVVGAIAVITGALGGVHESRSADPERDVDALLPCFAIIRSDEASIEEVVLMLKVLCESPPVPTMSHCMVVSDAFLHFNTLGSLSLCWWVIYRNQEYIPILRDTLPPFVLARSITVRDSEHPCPSKSRA